MKSKILIFTILFGILSLPAYAQPTGMKKADKHYNRYAYVEAIKTYERIASKGYKSIDLFQKLGNAYYFNSQFDKAAQWYGQLYELAPDMEAEYLYRYAQCLKALDQYEKSNEMMDHFSSKVKDDLRAKNYIANKNYLDVIKKNSGRYDLNNAGVNSTYSDYGGGFFNNQLVFASARDTGNFSKRIHKWTNQHFTNLYAAEIKEDSMGAVVSFGKGLNSKFNEAASAAFSKDGKTVYFTRNNYLKGKKGKSAERIILLKIYKATIKENKDDKGAVVNYLWTDVTDLSINSDEFSTAHPALSADGKTLYFASDRPGTYGQSDLWKVSINADGTLGAPSNLGETINTPGKETFPMITDEGELYFATDGHPGLGGLDIFMTKELENGSWKNPINIGTPGNSSRDDFAYLIDTKTRRGFLTSNREGGEGNDDIYKFLETRKLICEQLLAGIITDRITGEILPGAKVTLLDDRFNIIQVVYADDKGAYLFEVECDTNYYVRAEKEGYETKEQKITIPKESGKTTLDLQLEKKIKPVTLGDDLAKTFNIKEIYFDLDKWNIRKDAAVELAKILDVLTQYPDMKISIRSHTDSRASNKYNDKLSNRRAISTMQWFISKGIAADRLKAKGYGETKLVNKCKDGVKCTEAQHQLNRRSEFIIEELEKK